MTFIRTLECGNRLTDSCSRLRWALRRLLPASERDAMPASAALMRGTIVMPLLLLLLPLLRNYASAAVVHAAPQCARLELARHFPPVDHRSLYDRPRPQASALDTQVVEQGRWRPLA